MARSEGKVGEMPEMCLSIKVSVPGLILSLLCCSSGRNCQCSSAWPLVFGLPFSSRPDNWTVGRSTAEFPSVPCIAAGAGGIQVCRQGDVFRDADRSSASPIKPGVDEFESAADDLHTRIRQKNKHQREFPVAAAMDNSGLP